MKEEAKIWKEKGDVFKRVPSYKPVDIMSIRYIHNESLTVKSMQRIGLAISKTFES